MPNYMTYQQATDLADKIDEEKQDKLVPGDGINIDGNVISAPGSGSDMTVSFEDNTLVFSHEGGS